MLPWPSRGPKGMPRPWHPTHGACHALDMLPLPLRHPACPQGPCCLRPGACQRAHACTPRPWLLHARPGLGCCVLAQALPAACLWGAALALSLCFFQYLFVGYLMNMRNMTLQGQEVLQQKRFVVTFSIIHLPCFVVT